MTFREHGYGRAKASRSVSAPRPRPPEVAPAHTDRVALAVTKSTQSMRPHAVRYQIVTDFALKYSIGGTYGLVIPPSICEVD